MALKFNGTSIYSINYNNQDILNLNYNGTSIWAKRYTDVQLTHPKAVETDGVGYWANISNEDWQRSNISRRSSLDPNPSALTYNNNLVVHYGDVLRADGSIIDVDRGRLMTFPSGDNIRISDTSKEVKLSGTLLLPTTYMPTITFGESVDNITKPVYLTHFSNFGLSDYLCVWNNSESHTAVDYCRCWISVLKCTCQRNSSTGKYDITNHALPTGLASGKDGYDKYLGGWVLSPSDYFNNTKNFKVFSAHGDGYFSSRGFNLYVDTRGHYVLTCVTLATRNRYTNQYEYIQSFSCSANLSFRLELSSYWNSRIDSSGTVTRMVDEITDWMFFEI